MPETLDDLFDDAQTIDVREALTLLAREAQLRSFPGLRRWFVLPIASAAVEPADESEWERADTQPYAA